MKMQGKKVYGGSYSKYPLTITKVCDIFFSSQVRRLEMLLLHAEFSSELSCLSAWPAAYAALMPFAVSSAQIQCVMMEWFR